MSRPARPLAERFMEHFDVHPSGCWVWRGGFKSNGYGGFTMRGTTIRAHRASYEIFVGPIPEGLDIDHACNNRKCVDPAHLRPMTRQQNVARGGNHNRVKTHCPHGHAYDGANTFIDKRGFRYCRTCQEDQRNKARAS